MPTLPTILLHHRTPDPVAAHFDWLMATPLAPQGPLWGGRVAIASDRWAATGSFALDPLPPHRRTYLTFEGELTRGRGIVTRADRGTIEPLAWTDTRLILHVAMVHFTGRVELTLHGNDW